MICSIGSLTGDSPSIQHLETAIRDLSPIAEPIQIYTQLQTQHGPLSRLKDSLDNQRLLSLDQKEKSEPSIKIPRIRLTGVQIQKHLYIPARCCVRVEARSRVSERFYCPYLHQTA